MCKLNNRFLIFLILSIFIFSSCEEDVKDSVGTESTPGHEDITSGIQRSVTDYFYDLDNESVNARFLHYRKAEALYSNTIADTTKIDITKDTINFRTYNDFRLKVPEDEIQNYNQYIRFDETNNGSCDTESSSCVDIDYRNSQGEHYIIDNSSDPVLEDDGSEDGIDANWEGFSTSATGCINPSNDGIDNDNDTSVDEEDELGSPYACNDIQQSGEYEIFSHQFTSVEKIVWDNEDSRYKTYLDTTFIHYEDPDDSESDFTQSQWQYSSVDIALGTDTPIYNYDSLVYMVNINDFISPDTGIFYLDTLEFIKTNFLYTSDDIEIFQEFTFNNMQELASDSSIYRTLTDCNRNSQWDPGEAMIDDYNSDGDMIDILDEVALGQNYCGEEELNEICYEFSDSGNGIIDSAELYYDLNGNDQYDSSSQFGSEPFEDANCNGTWDDTELVDIGNGIWDDDEYFFDSGSLNGVYDLGEPIGSKVTSVPASLLFDYSNTPPSAVIVIDEFTQVQNADGVSYNVIDIVTILDSVYQYIPEVDSVITIFSNEIITHFASDPSKDLDYIITKTRSAYPDPNGGNIDISQYNYNIFNTENHIKELKNPSFFLPYGFYETPDDIQDGFWFDVCRDTLDIFLYAPDGIITSGANVFSVDTLIVNEDTDCDGDGISDNNGNGDYNIKINYDVEYLDADSVLVKMRKVLTDENGLCLGGLLHPSLDSLVVSNPEDCYVIPSNGGIGAAALDTLITDCFKITKTMTMTYIGSGVEYGERVTMWLARDLGIVKNYLDIRWSEPFWVDGEQWKPYSRWELIERIEDESGNGLGRFLGKRKVSIEDFENLIEFDNEPFQRRRTTGLHRVELIP